MMDKPLSFWTVVAGMAVWVFMSTPTESLAKRAGKTFVSGALAVGLSTEVATYLSISEGPAAVAIMAFGLIVLDILSDRKLLTEIIRGRLGAGGSKDEQK